MTGWSRGGESVWIEADCRVVTATLLIGYGQVVIVCPGLFEGRSTQYNWCQMGPSENREGWERRKEGRMFAAFEFKVRAES